MVTTGADVFTPRMDNSECAERLYVCCNTLKKNPAITAIPIIHPLLIGTSYALPNRSNVDDIFLDILSENWDNELNQPLPVTEPKPVTELQPLKSCGIQRICVPRYLCDNNDIVTTGAGVFEPRIDSSGAFNPHINSSECDSLHVCCITPRENPAITALPTILPLLIGTSNALINSSNVDALNQPLPVRELQPLNYKSCGIQGLCVPRFLCNKNEIVTTGAGAFEPRIGRSGAFDPHIDSSECDFLHVCCNAPKEASTSINTQKRIFPSCGHRNPDGIGSDIGFDISAYKDYETKFGEFPWMVVILRKIPDADEITTYRYACGGSLIAPTVMLTAAHCVRKFVANNLIARAGEWDVQSKTEILPDQDRQVHEIILHENYNEDSLFNDIALLIVDNPFIYEQNVRPICLPPPNTNFDFSRCYATGWGKDKAGKDGMYQVILKKIELPVVPWKQCQTTLRRTRLGEFYDLHESFICAGGELDKDTCTGDGGSPLVCPIEGKDNQFYQAGIVAYGVGCGYENIPGVYANVAHLRPWINAKLSAMRVDFSHFTA